MPAVLTQIIQILRREHIPVRADVYTIGGLSAHADQPALLDWLTGFAQAPGRSYIVHGEAAAAESLRGEIDARFGWRVHVPHKDERVALAERAAVRGAPLR